MKIGIVGLPKSGKTSLFNLLTGQRVATTSFGTARGEIAADQKRRGRGRRIDPDLRRQTGRRQQQYRGPVDPRMRQGAAVREDIFHGWKRAANPPALQMQPREKRHDLIEHAVNGGRGEADDHQYPDQQLQALAAAAVEPERERGQQ